MKDRNDRLRDLLREGDPAAGDPGLTPEEVQAMRRTVLAAVPEPRRRGWLVPVLATAAGLVLAAVLVLALWQPPTEKETAHHDPAPQAPDAGSSPRGGGGLALGNQEGGVSRIEDGGRRSAPLLASPRIQPPPPRGEEPAPPRPVETLASVEETPAPTSVTPAPSEQQAALPAAPEGQRQIQFSTPGGTRVIWMLDPATE